MAERRLLPKDQIKRDALDPAMRQRAKEMEASAGSRATGKPKLSAPEVAAMLRKEYGSEQAGRMLYGKGRGRDILPPAERQAAIKRLAPGESTLPDAARKIIKQRLLEASPEEALAYAAKAPNTPAASHFGDLLKQALLARMQGQKP